MLEGDGSLIVEITGGNRLTYNGVEGYYSLSRTSVILLSYLMSGGLGGCGDAVVSLTPDWLCSESMLDGFGSRKGTGETRLPSIPGSRSRRPRSMPAAPESARNGCHRPESRLAPPSSRRFLSPSLCACPACESGPFPMGPWFRRAQAAARQESASGGRRDSLVPPLGPIAWSRGMSLFDGMPQRVTVA